MKKCTCCKIPKPYSEYHSKGNGKFATRCKDCTSQLLAMRYKTKKKVTEMQYENWKSNVLEQWLGNYP